MASPITTVSCLQLSGIDGSDCIGDSRRVINDNVTKLGEAVCNISADVNALENTLYPPSSGLKLNPSNKLHVDLDPGGGLEFNAELQVRIRPTLPTVRIAVRPSVGIDNPAIKRNINTITNDSTVAGPYFKSLGGATVYMNQNPANNYIVFIDEDSNETLIPENVSVFTSTGSTTMQVSSVATLPSNFVSANLKPGAYIWNNSTSPTRSAVIGTRSQAYGIQGTLVIMSRYDAGGGVFTTTRKFNQAPKKVIYNLYVSNSNTLAYGNLGTDPSNWSLIPFYYTTDQIQYFPFRPFYWSNIDIVELRNICFEFDSNCTDTTCIYFNYSRCTLINTTVKVGGSTRYSWGAVLCDSVGVIVLGRAQDTTQRLADPVTNTLVYPGHGLAIVGPDNYSVDMLYGIRMYSGVRLFGFTNVYYGSASDPGIGTVHHGAIIIAGRINFSGYAVIGQGTTTSGDSAINASPILFLKNGSVITGYMYTLGSITERPGFRPATTNYSVIPVYMERYNSIQYWFANGFSDAFTLRQWSVTPTTNPPILTNGYLRFWNLNGQTPSIYGTFAGGFFTYSAFYQNSNISIYSYDPSNNLTISNTGGWVGTPPSFDQAGAWNINGYTLNYYA